MNWSLSKSVLLSANFALFGIMFDLTMTYALGIKLHGMSSWYYLEANHWLVQMTYKYGYLIAATIQGSSTFMFEILPIATTYILARLAKTTSMLVHLAIINAGAFMMLLRIAAGLTWLP